MPADDEAHAVLVLVQAVEHREIALAGHAEQRVHAMDGQGVGKDLAAGAVRVGRAVGGVGHGGGLLG